jgi:hypothetical protein
MKHGNITAVRPIVTVPRTDGFSCISESDFLVTDQYVTENFEKLVFSEFEISESAKTDGKGQYHQFAQTGPNSELKNT